MMTEAEVGYELQGKNTKDFRLPPEAKRGEEGLYTVPERSMWPADTFIWDFQPLER